MTFFAFLVCLAVVGGVASWGVYLHFRVLELQDTLEISGHHALEKRISDLEIGACTCNSTALKVDQLHDWALKDYNRHDYVLKVPEAQVNALLVLAKEEENQRCV